MAVADHIHLGPQQQRVWQIARLRPDASWQARCRLRWPAPLDRDRLNAALAQLSRRHIQLEYGIDISGPAPALAPGAPLQLQDGPQGHHSAQCWIEPGEASAVLHLAAPSVLLDSQSLALIAAELEQLYSGATLAPPTIQYNHFVAWQQELLDEPEAAAGAAFWRAYAPGAALLPTAGGRLPSAERWRVAQPVSAELAAALAAADDPEALWIGSLLLTCWHLGGRQGQPGIWRTLANREETSTADLVGLVARTVPLSVPIYPTDRPAGLIERIQQALDDQIDAVDYFADPPLNQRQIVLEWLAPHEGQAATLLEAFSPIEDGGLFCQIWQAEQPQLVLYGESGWLGQRDGQQFAAQWLHVLAALTAGQDRQISQLPLVSAAELALLLDTFNATAASWHQSLAIPQAIAAQAARTPAAPAVEWQGTTVGYGELHAQALKLAAVLRERGVGRDDIVGIYLERSADFVLALLGSLYAGAAYMPLDPANPASRLQSMLEDVPPRLVLTSRQLAPALPGAVATLALDEVSGHPGPPLEQPLPVLPEQLAYIIFTSGSTGRPKAVGVAHAALQNRMEWAQRTYPLQPQDHLLQTTALGFDFAVWECLAPLLAGAKLVIPAVNSHLDSAELVRIINTQRISVLHFVPALFQPFVEELAPQSCPSLRLVFSGGEALGAPLAARFMTHSAAQLYNQYGPTEATIDATFKLCDAADAGGSAVVSIGRPVANTQIYILNASLEPVAIGMVGQLYIAGVGLARGYLGQPERTAERFLPNPFGAAPGTRIYATGDLASWSPDGQINYLGRSDDQIKVRGVRVELGEVEAALNLYSEVRQCAVKPHQQGQLTRLVAYVVPRDPEAPPSVTALREYSLSRLPDFMVPAAFVILPKLPLTASGKVDRLALPNPESARPFIETAYVAPATPLERVLASLWSDILGISPIGLNDDFFELGGYSLLATQLVARMRRLLRIELPLISVFEATTIAKLASYMQAHEAVPGQTNKIASAIIKIKQMSAN